MTTSSCCLRIIAYGQLVIRNDDVVRVLLFLSDFFAVVLCYLVTGRLVVFHEPTRFLTQYVHVAFAKVLVTKIRKHDWRLSEQAVAGITASQQIIERVSDDLISAAINVHRLIRLCVAATDTSAVT